MKRTRTKGDGFTDPTAAITVKQLPSSINRSSQMFFPSGKTYAHDINVYFTTGNRHKIIATRQIVAQEGDYVNRGGKYYWKDGVEKRLLGSFKKLVKELVAEANGYVEANHEDQMVTIPSRYELEVCHDVVTPNFKALMKRGVVVNSPYSKNSLSGTFGVKGASRSALRIIREPTLRCYHQSRHYTPASLRIEYSFGVEWSYGDSKLDPNDFDKLISELSVSQLESQNQTALNTAFGNKTDADFDLSVFIAESQSTISFVASRMRTVASLVHDLKSGRWVKWAPKAWKKYSRKGELSPLALADGLADAWLEMRYAWCPLIMDVNGAIKTLKKGELTPRQTFRGYAADSDDTEIDITLPSGATCTGTITSTRSSRAGILTSVDVNSALGDRWGLMTWANTAWELVPFSFVIDWFIDIGALLKATTSFVYKDLAIYVTDKELVLFNGEIDTGSSKIPVQIVRETTIRDPHGTPQYASFNINLNLTRLTDAAALLLRMR